MALKKRNMGEESNISRYGKTMAVLLVEDEKISRSHTVEILTRRFGEVHVAVNGLAGLNAYKTNHPDIIITDIRMPGMDGLTMARKIRGVNPVQPIIILTAYNRTEYLMHSIEIGIGGYLIKPVKLKEVDYVLNKVIGKMMSTKEELVRSLAMDNSPTAILMLDKDGNITYCNRKLLEMFGFGNKEEILNKPGTYLFKQITSRNFTNAKIKTPATGLKEKFIAKRKSGVTFEVEVLVSPVKDKRGNVVGKMGVLTDLMMKKRETRMERRSVMIVDDSPFMRKLLERILVPEGFLIAAQATNGLEALELYEETLPDVIIMDIVMPVMDGIEATQVLSKNYPDIKILMCTHVINESVRKRVEHLGVSGYILKPFKADMIIKELNRVLSL